MCMNALYCLQYARETCIYNHPQQSYWPQTQTEGTLAYAEHVWLGRNKGLGKRRGGDWGSRGRLLGQGSRLFCLFQN